MNSSDFYCILVHYDEIAIKLGNRNWFEKQLIHNIKNQISDLKYSKIQRFAGRVFINHIDFKKKDIYLQKIKNVMGVSSVHLMLRIPASIDLIKQKTIDALESFSDSFNSFKVFTKRQNKSFSMSSPDINATIGDLIRIKFNKIVNLKNPDLELRIEIVDDFALIGFEISRPNCFIIFSRRF